jgi:hypothetical protein
MTEGDLVTFETVGDMEEALSPFPGAQETGVFSVLGAICSPPNVGELDMIWKLFCLKKISESVGFPGVEAEIDVDRHELIMNGDALAPLMEKVEQG